MLSASRLQRAAVCHAAHAARSRVVSVQIRAFSLLRPSSPSTSRVSASLLPSLRPSSPLFRSPFLLHRGFAIEVTKLPSLGDSITEGTVVKWNKTPLAAAKRAAANKRRRYEAVAATQCAEFIPFACESTGGIGQDADDLINRLSLASKDHLTLSSHHPLANSIHSTVASPYSGATPSPSSLATREPSAEPTEDGAGAKHDSHA